ncbi:type IV pilus modification protein PilV [Desulfatitalea alkaliphila]|uniref:Type IV pilus modification protein PilV n=1 Tax=Desulfatitalea alkaliphila TaxID=2929485 RepID=A0AA41UH73_9BACT|nr:type IV pilus modification protein PilV [Desulfatitalea alkaliphila]MCJ8499305.1 type IV pilus modification protein PilV [Desulfatitalea alkaliphila]
MKADPSHKKKIHRDETGFTLIEAMIAILVFTIGILATISMQITSIQGNALARNNTEAAAIAANLAEELRSFPYSDASLQQGNHALPDVGNYSVSYTVQDDAILADTKSVRITVGWTTRATPRNVIVDYLFYDTI